MATRQVCWAGTLAWVKGCTRPLALGIQNPVFQVSGQTKRWASFIHCNTFYVKQSKNPVVLPSRGLDADRKDQYQQVGRWQLGWVVKDLLCREGPGKGLTVLGPWGAAWRKEFGAIDQELGELRPRENGGELFSDPPVRQAGLDPKAFPGLSQLLPSPGPGTPQGVASQCFHQVSSDVCFYLGVRGSPTANFSGGGKAGEGCGKQ